MKAVAAFVPLLALAACNDGAASELPTTPVECALAGAGGFAPDCTMERTESDGQGLLVIRHPDGSFRRFELGVPGRGIVTADGVQPAEVERSDGLVEIRVGPDRYRLPVGE